MNDLFIKKHHPKELEDIVGQNKIILSLKKIIKNKYIPKFLFFFGKEGLGKNTCANIIAKKLNNKFSNTKNNIRLIEFYNELENSCDLEKTLKKFLFNNEDKKNYNVFVINKSNIISSRFFMIIEYIKKIEIKNVIFIICITNKKNIPNFIFNNSYVLYFKKISTRDIFFHIKMISEKEKIEIEKEALFIISQHSCGSIGKAITTLSKIITDDNKKIITKDLVINKLKLVDKKNYFKLIDHLLNDNLHDILIIIKNILYKECKNPFEFINGLKKHVKNLLLHKNGNVRPIILNYNKDLINYYNNQSKNISFFLLNKILEMCFNINIILFSYNYDKNNNINSIIETYFINISSFFSLYKEKKDEILTNKKFFITQKKIDFIMEYWNKFIINTYENIIIIKKLINETKFEILNDKIIIIIPNIENYNLSLIHQNFTKFYEKKIHDVITNIKIINKKNKDNIINKKNFDEIKKNKDNIINKKNKFIDSLIKRLNLKNHIS